MICRLIGVREQHVNIEEVRAIVPNIEVAKVDDNLVDVSRTFSATGIGDPRAIADTHRSIAKITLGPGLRGAYHESKREY